jgi:hypothetical protein
MISALQTVLDYAAPLPAKNERHQLKTQFIRNTATETAVIGLFTGLSCYFAMNNELRWAFLQQAFTVSSVNLMARTVATTCRYAAIVDRGLFFRTVSFGVDFIAPLYFAQEFKSFYYLIHEGGHALSTYLLSQKATIQVIANSLGNWKTYSTIMELSKIGKYLGAHYSRMLITAAGPLATVVTNQITMIFALRFKNSYPEFSKFLFFPVLNSLIKEFEYAKSALSIAHDHPDYSGHDFVIIWKEGGVHPTIAMVALVILPLITTLSYLKIRRQ